MTTNLERWNYYLQDLESPQLFIDWTFYATVSAALQRRVCVGGLPHVPSSGQIFPNLYVVFIGPPGIGKTIAGRTALNLFKQFDKVQPGETTTKVVQLIKRAADSITLEALLKYLGLNYTSMEIPPQFTDGIKGKIYTSAPVAFFASEELGTLIKEDTNDFVTYLCQGWDCQDFIRETKTQGTDFIKNSCVTLLGSATPEWVKHSMNSRLLGEGFAARVIFVFGDTKRKSVFQYRFTKEQQHELNIFAKHIEKLTQLYGEVTFTAEAMDFMKTWYESGNIILNKDRRLLYYYSRKKVQLMKLSMAIHFSESTTMTVGIDSVQSALKMLAATEMDMHKALSGSGRNELAGIADLILNYIRTHGICTFRQLYLEFFNEGTQEELMSAISWLQDTQQLEGVEIVGARGYKIPSSSAKDDVQ